MKRKHWWLSLGILLQFLIIPGVVFLAITYDALWVIWPMLVLGIGLSYLAIPCYNRFAGHFDWKFRWDT